MFAFQIQMSKLAEVLRNGKYYAEMHLNRDVIASVLKASSSVCCISELGSVQLLDCPVLFNLIILR